MCSSDLADAQHNLVGPFGIDRLPQTGRVFSKSGEQTAADGAEDTPAAEGEAKARRVGNPRLVPELFDALDPAEVAENESAEKLQNLDFSKVTEADKVRDNRQPKSRVLDDEPAAEAATGEESSEATETSAAEDTSTSAAATAGVLLRIRGHDVVMDSSTAFRHIRK